MLRVSLQMGFKSYIKDSQSFEEKKQIYFFWMMKSARKKTCSRSTDEFTANMKFWWAHEELRHFGCSTRLWTVFVSLTSRLWIREHLDTLWGVIAAQVFQLSPHQLTPSEESGGWKGGQDEFFFWIHLFHKQLCKHFWVWWLEKIFYD